MTNHVGMQLGTYRLTRLLGQGGFADVYLGEHIYIKTEAAVKVLRSGLSKNEMEKFYQEAAIVASLDHPHIIRVLHFDIQDLGISKNVPFLVISYAPGGTLLDRHPQGVQVPLFLIVSYMKQVTSALQYVHDKKKLVHGDIKPANMLIGRNNEILLSDFGTATFTHSYVLGTEEKIVGTLQYMAPEQIMGKAQRASDQYALGTIVYQWLSGFLPFNGSVKEIISQHLTVPPPPFNKNLRIPLEVEQVVLRALAKEPDQRFASVQDFATALEQACQPMQQRKQHQQPIEKIPTQPLVLAQQPIILKDQRREIQERGIKIGERVTRLAMDWGIVDSSPEGKIIVSHNNELYTYNLYNDKLKLLPEISFRNGVHFSQSLNYFIFYAGSSGGFSIYNIEDGRLIYQSIHCYLSEWLKNDSGVVMVSNPRSSDNLQNVAKNPGKIRNKQCIIYDLKRRKSNTIFSSNKDILRADLSPGKTYLSILEATIRDKVSFFMNVYVYDIRLRKNISQLLVHNASFSLNSCWISNDKYIIPSNNSTFTIYNILTGLSIKEIQLEQYQFLSISPDTQYAIVKKGKNMKGEYWRPLGITEVFILDTRTRTIIFKLPHEYSDSLYIFSQWSPDGKYVVIEGRHNLEKDYVIDIYLLNSSNIELARSFNFPFAVKPHIINLVSNGYLIRYIQGEPGKPLELVEIYEEG